MRAVQSLASARFRLLSERGVSDPLLLSVKEMSNWDTQLEVVGLIIDTEALRVTLPSQKRLKLHIILGELPPSRASATSKKVSQLDGFVIYIFFAVSPGGRFVTRVLASVGMLRKAELITRFCMANPERRLAQGLEFHGDLEFGRRFDEEGLDTREVPMYGAMSVAMYHLHKRPS